MYRTCVFFVSWESCVRNEPTTCDGGPASAQGPCRYRMVRPFYSSSSLCSAGTSRALGTASAPLHQRPRRSIGGCLCSASTVPGSALIWNMGRLVSRGVWKGGPESGGTCGNLGTVLWGITTENPLN